MRLIDADALKEYIDTQKDRVFTGCTVGEALKIITDEQPTIEERKMGRWIEEIIDDEKCVYCSECRDEYIENELELDSWVKNYFNYCPYCGAMMEVEHETDR